MADLRALPASPGSLAGIVAWYSIIHVAPAHLATTFNRFHDALAPGGRLLLTFHIGDQVQHVEDLWGHPVDLDFVFFQPEEIERLLRQAGFLVDDALERAPYPDIEVQTRRSYLLATRG